MSDVAELPTINSVYPGCLVSLITKGSGGYSDDRVIMLDDAFKKMTHASIVRRLPLPSKNMTGVVIEIFPNALVRVPERTWIVYFHPVLAVIEQSRLRRVSFSWKESRK